MSEPGVVGGAGRRVARSAGVAAALAATLGLAEWAWTSRLGADLGQLGALRGALAAGAGWGAAGALAGALAGAWARPRLDGLAAALGAAAALLVAAHTSGRLGEILAVGAAAWAGAVLGRALPGPRPGPAQAAAGLAVALGGLVALSAAAAPGPTRALAAALGACAAVVLALAGGRGARRAAPAAGLALAVGVALALAWRPAAQAVRGAPEGATSVLLVTLDTLRADRVGAYGHAAARTPAIDGLAAQGVRFDPALTAVRFTGPSHASILTGLRPDHHGLVHNGVRLPRDVGDLASWLGARGWATGAFVGGWTVSDAASGLPSRFRDRDDAMGPLAGLPRPLRRTSPFRLLVRGLHARGVELDPPRRPAAAVAARAGAWLGRHHGQPFFAWVHCFDPHLPYEPPEAFLDAAARAYRGPADGRWYVLDEAERLRLLEDPEAVAQMGRLYDAAIASADAAVGEVVAAARAAAPGGRLLVVVTSDHGESFGEHDLWWERDLYEPTARVPLVLAGAGVTVPGGTVLHHPARSIDLAPTLMELLGLPVPEGLDGDSLAALLRGEPGPPAEPAVLILGAEEGEPPAAAARGARYKVIRREEGFAGRVHRDERLEVYDLLRDPGELRDLSAQPPPAARPLLAAIPERRAHAVGPPRRGLDDDERRMLQALGYVR